MEGMLYRELGKSGCMVSALGLGCMRLPTVEGETDRFLPVDEKAASRLIAEAVDLGITYFDTAYPYHQGTSEAALGRGLAEAGARARVCVATKISRDIFARPELWEKTFAAQCERLRTDYIDAYLAHSLTRARWETFIAHGGLDYLARLKASGRVRALGFSFHDDLATFRRIVEAFPWDFCQIQYNYLDTRFQAGEEGYALAVAAGLGVISMETLKGGSLARPLPSDMEAIWQELETESPVGPSVSPAERALRWVLDKPGIACALSGMGTVRELRENAATAASHQPESLTPTELRAFARAAERFNSRHSIGCTGCSYCMPCPGGVDIPGIFQVYNHYKLFGDRPWADVMYNMALASNQARADACLDCGACEDACPQHLPVRQLLREVHPVLLATGKSVS